MELPRTLYHLQPGNRLEQRFYGTVPIERATAYFFYSSESPYHQILYQLKYRNHRQMAIYMGKSMAGHLMSEGRFFEGVDWLLPVPLSANRLRTRGYNQCDLLAKGISGVTGIPIAGDCLVRHVDNPTQTRRTSLDRWKNVEGIFGLSSHAAEKLSGKHILLIDDVVTTGATLTACAKTIREGIPDCRISVASLAATESF